ncbi:hypothetical protein J3E68DRAFT_404835 [Trichoderma sp. SZMC 28012]
MDYEKRQLVSISSISTPTQLSMSSLSLSSSSVLFCLLACLFVCHADRAGINNCNDKRKWGDCEDERFSSSAWNEQTIDLPLIANGPLHDIAWPDPQVLCRLASIGFQLWE